jgi:hypothetical protein
MPANESTAVVSSAKKKKAAKKKAQVLKLLECPKNDVFLKYYTHKALPDFKPRRKPSFLCCKLSLPGLLSDTTKS